MVAPQRHSATTSTSPGTSVAAEHAGPLPPSRAPTAISAAAARYQQMRALELEQLAIMSRQRLLDAWTDDVRDVVLEARACIHAAREAREAFRGEVRRFIDALRDDRQPLSAVLRRTRAMLRALEGAGVLEPEDGRLEAEVLEWVIEDYESAA